MRRTVQKVSRDPALIDGAKFTATLRLETWTPDVFESTHPIAVKQTNARNPSSLIFRLIMVGGVELSRPFIVYECGWGRGGVQRMIYFHAILSRNSK